MPSILLKSEAVAIEVGSQVYWVKLDTRRVRPEGGGEETIQFWAFLPPGMRPSTLRGKDRESLIAEIGETIGKQVSTT
jgi:hypothetical protein